MSAANGNDTVSAWMQLLLGLLGLVLRRRRDAGQQEGQVGRLVDELAQLLHLVDRRLVGDGEPDDDVGRRPVGADEAVVAGLGPADDVRRPARPRRGGRASPRSGPGTPSDRASSPASPRKSATIVPPPAPNSSASRSLTAADSESGSVQPPALSAPVTCAARKVEAMAMRTARTTIGRAEAVDERSPGGGTSDGYPWLVAALSVRGHHRE